MRKSRKKSNKKLISSVLVVLVTMVVVTGSILSSASKITRADANTLDNIQNQIVTLDGLKYSSDNIKKTIEMNNKDVSLYIVNYSDRIIIGRLNAKDEPEDIREIELTHSKN